MSESLNEWRQNLGHLAAPATVAKVNAADVEGPTPCMVCGAEVRRDEAEVWGPWRRHPRCSPLVGSPIDRLVVACGKLGIANLTRTDAALVEFQVHNYSDSHESPVWATERVRDRLLPWRFVDRKALVTAIKALPRLRRHAGLDPSRCRDGACAWCGRPESLGWFTSSLRWPNGDPAPLCRRCHEVDVRHGQPIHRDDLPALLAEAITGVPVMSGESAPAGLVPYCEVNASSGIDGSEPWAHLPSSAIEGYRWHVWGRFGGAYSPPEHRQEALERWEATEAARMARMGEKLASEVAKADTFGFTGSETDEEVVTP